MPKFLASDECKDDVAQMLKHTKYSLRVTGVPTFFVSNAKGKQVRFSGGQPVESFLAYFARLGIEIDDDAFE